MSVREWECPNCGMNHDRDLNAAKNILVPLLAVAACGANVRPDRYSSKRQLRKTRLGDRSRNLNREVWESPRLYAGEDVKR